MMIVITVALVLFAGISSPAIAEEQIPSQLESAANSNVDSPQPLEHVELLKKECLRNGGPEAYQIFEQSEESILSDCVFGTLEVLKPTKGIVGTTLRDIAKTSLKNWCPDLSVFKSCIGKLTENLKACYEPKDREAVNVISNTIGGLLDFLCTSEGDFLTKFVTTGGVECARSNADPAKECIQQIFRNYVSAGANEQGQLQPPQDFTEKTIIGNYLPCISKAMTKCETPGPADVVNSLHHSFIQQSP